MAKLDGKVAVITGASSGIGEATAEALAAEGASVVVAARRKDRLSELVERINSNGGKAVSVECDVTDEEAEHDLIRHAKDELAGRGGHPGEQRRRDAALQDRERPLGPVAPDVRRERVGSRMQNLLN